MLDPGLEKSFRYFKISALMVLLLVACGGPGQTATQHGYSTPDWKLVPAQLPGSLKGYELYSWQSGEDWVFTLATGTNRSKSFEEITSPENNIEDGYIKITVNSMEDLETLLKRLPAGVEVNWSGIDLSGEVEEGTVYFSYPPQESFDKIAAWAEELDIRLHTLQNP